MEASFLRSSRHFALKYATATSKQSHNVTPYRVTSYDPQTNQLQPKKVSVPLNAIPHLMMIQQRANLRDDHCSQIIRRDELRLARRSALARLRP